MILDTYVWVRFTNKTLNKEAEASIYNVAKGGLYVCTISNLEIATLVRLGRLDLGMSVGTWLRRALAETGCKLLYLEPEIAELSMQLPGNFESSDPRDKVIVATGILKNLIIATTDQAMIDYPHADTLDCR